MSESLLNIAIDELLKCSFCNSKLKNPFALPCFHSFCCDCIKANHKSNSQSINCPKCFNDHSCVNGVEKTFKPSSLCRFLLKLNDSNEEDKKENENKNENENENENEKEGVCIECPAYKNLPKTNLPKGPQNEEQTPLLVKLFLCHHCKKFICTECKTKHYNQQKDETVSELNSLNDGSVSLANINERLNDIRGLKIYEYTKLKEVIKQKHLDLIQNLSNEEKTLLEKLDTQIELEKKKLEHSNNEQKRLIASKQVTKSIRDMVFNEKNPKKLSDLCQDFSNAKNEWRLQLKTEAESNDPNKETRLIFQPSTAKKEMIGSLEQKKENLKLQRGLTKVNIAESNEKTSICIIL